MIEVVVLGVAMAPSTSNSRNGFARTMKTDSKKKGVSKVRVTNEPFHSSMSRIFFGTWWIF